MTPSSGSLRRWTFACFVVLFCAVGAPEVRLAQAASIVVNTLADTDTTDDCSLREAINTANGNFVHLDSGSGFGNDTITFSVSGTVLLTATLPTIADAAGLTIDGGGASRNHTARTATVWST